MIKTFFNFFLFFLFIYSFTSFLHAFDDSEIFVESVLFTAVKKSDYDKATELLEKGVHPNIVDGENLVPLAYALKNDNKKMFELLIQHGADIQKKILNKSSLLTFYITNGRYLLINDILEAGANINYQDKVGRTAIMIAIERMNVNAVEILIKQKFDAELGDFSGKTIFGYAKSSRNNKIRKLIGSLKTRN